MEILNLYILLIQKFSDNMHVKENIKRHQSETSQSKTEK